MVSKKRQYPGWQKFQRLSVSFYDADRILWVLEQ